MDKDDNFILIQVFECCRQTIEFKRHQASFTTNLELSLYILCTLLILSGRK